MWENGFSGLSFTVTNLPIVYNIYIDKTEDMP